LDERTAAVGTRTLTHAAAELAGGRESTPTSASNALTAKATCRNQREVTKPDGRPDLVAVAGAGAGAGARVATSNAFSRRARRGVSWARCRSMSDRHRRSPSDKDTAHLRIDSSVRNLAPT
jgi:hypothetical protein